MLTEISNTQYKIIVEGRVVASNIPSYQLAEATVFSLPADQRAVAQIVPITPEGKTVLFG